MSLVSPSLYDGKYKQTEHELSILLRIRPHNNLRANNEPPEQIRQR